MAQYVKNSINFHGARSKTVSNEEESSKKSKRGKKKRHDSNNNNSRDANIDWGMPNGNSASTTNVGYESWDNNSGDTWNQNKKSEDCWGSRRPDKRKESFWDNIDQEFPPIASQKNVWKEREKKFEEMKYMQPTNEDEEEKMLRLALELSKAEVNENSDIRKRLEDEYQLQQEMLKNNPGEFQDFILPDECAGAAGWKSGPSQETASASLGNEWDAQDYICPSNSSSKHKDLDFKYRNATAENHESSMDSSNWDNYDANPKQSYADSKSNYKHTGNGNGGVGNSNKNKTKYNKSNSNWNDEGTKRKKEFSSNRNKDDGLWDDIEDDSFKNQTPPFENKFHNTIKTGTKEDTNSRINKVVSMFGGWGGSSKQSNSGNNSMPTNTDHKADVFSAPNKKKAYSFNQSDIKKSSSTSKAKVNEAHVNSKSNISLDSALTSDSDVFYDAVDDNTKNVKTENNMSSFEKSPGNSNKDKEIEPTIESSDLSERAEINLGISEQEDSKDLSQSVSQTKSELLPSKIEDSVQDIPVSYYEGNINQKDSHSKNEALFDKQGSVSKYVADHSDNFQTSKIEDLVKENSFHDASLSNFNQNTNPKNCSNKNDVLFNKQGPASEYFNDQSDNFETEIASDLFTNPDPFKEGASDAVFFIEAPKPATTSEHYPEQLEQNTDLEFNDPAIKAPVASQSSDFVDAPKPSAHNSESALNFNSSETVDPKPESMPQFPSMGMPTVPLLPVNPMMGMFMNPAMMAGMNPMVMQHMMMFGSPFIANQLMTMDMYYRSLGITPGLPQMYPPHMLGMHPTFLGQNQPEQVVGQSNVAASQSVENTSDNFAEDMNLHNNSSTSAEPTGNVFGSNSFINSPVMPENSFESSSFNSSSNIHVNQPTINSPVPAPRNAQIDPMCTSYESNLPSANLVIPEKHQSEPINPSDFDDAWLMSYLSDDKKGLSIPPPVQPSSNAPPEVPFTPLTIGAECKAVSLDKKPAFSSNSVCDKSLSKPVASSWGDVDDGSLVPDKSNAKNIAKPVATGWGDLDDCPSKTKFNEDLDGWGNDNYTAKAMGNSSRVDSSKRNMTRQPSRQPNVHRFKR